MWDNWRKELTPDLRRRGIWIEVGGHGYENYLNAEMEGGQLFARHPEWFHMDGSGKRIRNTHAVFCTSSREAKQYFIANVSRYLEARPEIEVFDFWPPDGAKWCQCPKCKALGTPSDRQALLLAEVSATAHRTRPGLRFETIAYAACVAPPLQAAMDSSVLVDFCPIAQCFEYQIGDPKSDRNADYVGQLKAWLKSFQGDISIYSYYRKYAWRSLPNIMPHYIQNDLRFYRDLGARGISSYAEPGDWGTYELNHYVLGGLAWNPDANVDKMIGDFARARFGSRADLAKEAYKLLEDNVRRVCSLPGTTLKTSTEYQRAADAFRALARRIESQMGMRSGPDGTPLSGLEGRLALKRLSLAFDYGIRDLLLQKARVEKLESAKRSTQLADLDRFLGQHAQEGVFVVQRIPLAKQAARYGVGQD